MTDERPDRPGPRRAAVEARLPLRGRRRGGGHPPRVRPLPRRSAPAPWPPATSASPPGPSCAPSTPANPGRSSPSTRSRSATPTCSATRPTTTRRSCCALSRHRGRRLQPEVHPPRLRRLLPGRRGPLALPVPRRQLRDRDRRRHLRPADPTARPHRRRGPRRRHDLGAREPAVRTSDRASRRTTTPSCIYVIILVVVPGVPHHRRRRGVPAPTTSRWPGRPPRSRSSLAARGRALPALPAALTGMTTRRGRTSARSPTLFPGYFALVMATGIIAIGAAQQDLDWLADAPVRRRRGRVRRPRRAHRRPPGRATRELLVSRPDQPRQGLRVPHHRRRHQRARQRVGGHPRWWTFAWVAVDRRRRPLARAALHRRCSASILGDPSPGSAKASTAPGSCSPSPPNRSPCSARCCSATHDPSDLLAFACLAAFTLGLVLYLIVMTMVFLRWTF